jgi:hypothetical protein
MPRQASSGCRGKHGRRAITAGARESFFQEGPLPKDKRAIRKSRANRKNQKELVDLDCGIWNRRNSADPKDRSNALSY